MKKLRCFVAMAFGYGDADAVFDIISNAFPNIDFRRVDRINHNSDIDDQIVTELKAADFVISDLTYARPSVYWEAGYAQGRPINVIYTARADHIGTRQKKLIQSIIEQWGESPERAIIERALTDAHRVHFDLQMRNIIDWKIPTDRKFLKRLKDRVKLVTAPLLRNRVDALAKADRLRQFAALSQHLQLEATVTAASDAIKKVGFRFEPYKNDKTQVPARSKMKWQTLTPALRMSGSVLQIVTVSALPTLRGNDLWRIHNRSWLVRLNVNLNITKQAPKQIEFITLILSLGRITSNTLRNALPSATWNENMVATLVDDSLFIPNRRLWTSGKIVRQASSAFQVRNHLVIADVSGTYLQTKASSNMKGQRVGNAIKCTVLRRYRVISGINDATIVPTQIAQTLGTTHPDFDETT